MAARSGSSPDNRPAAPARAALDRVTVNLTPRAARALDDTVALTGDNKTDTINRALQIHNYVERALSAGGELYVRRSPDTEPELVKIL